MGQDRPKKKQKGTIQSKALQFAEILQRMDDGESIGSIAKDQHMPNASVIRKWLREKRPGDNQASKSIKILTEEVFSEMLEMYADGKTVSAICEKPGFPTRQMFYMALRQNDKWLDRFNDAHDLHLQSTLDRATRLAEDVLNDGIAPPNFNAWFQVHKFIIGRSQPSRFDGKRQHGGDGDPIPLHESNYVDVKKPNDA